MKKVIGSDFLLAGVFFPALLIFYGFYISSERLIGFRIQLIFVLWAIYVFIFFLPFLIECKRKDVFSPPIVIAITESFSILQPMYLISNEWRGVWIFSGGNDIENSLLLFVFLSILAKIAFYVFYYSTLNKWSNHPGFKSFDINPTLKVGLICILIGFFAYLTLMAMNGGLVSYLNNLHARRQANEGNAWLMQLIYFMLIGGWIIIPLSNSKWPKLWEIIIHGFVFIVILSMGGRGLAFKYAFISLMVYSYFRNRISLNYLLVIAIVGFVFSHILQEIRSGTSKGGIESALNYYNEKDEVGFNAMDSSEIERTLVLLKSVPEEQNFTFFSTYLNLLTNFIPRSLYPEKPGLSESSVYAHLFTSDKSGRMGMYPAGNIGDYYLQLGAVSVILFFSLQGLILSKVYSVSCRNGNLFYVLVYSIIILFGFYRLRNLFIFQSVLVLLSLVFATLMARLKLLK